MKLTKEQIEAGKEKLKRSRPELFRKKRITGNTRNAAMREMSQTTAKVTEATVFEKMSEERKKLPTVTAKVTDATVPGRKVTLKVETETMPAHEFAQRRKSAFERMSEERKKQPTVTVKMDGEDVVVPLLQPRKP